MPLGPRFKPHKPNDAKTNLLGIKLVAEDQDLFQRLAEKYLTSVYNYLLRLTGSVHDAEDLTQETFLRAYTHLHQYRVDRSFRAWLFRIARNIFLNWLRKRRQEALLFPDGEQNELDALAFEQFSSQDCLYGLGNGHIWEIARHLPQKQFELLWLRYVEGLDSGDIARVTGLAPVHVRVLLYRARQKLLKLIERSGSNK